MMLRLVALLVALLAPAIAAAQPCPTGPLLAQNTLAEIDCGGAAARQAARAHLGVNAFTNTALNLNSQSAIDALGPTFPNQYNGYTVNLGGNAMTTVTFGPPSAYDPSFQVELADTDVETGVQPIAAQLDTAGILHQFALPYGGLEPAAISVGWRVTFNNAGVTQFATVTAKLATQQGDWGTYQTDATPAAAIPGPVTQCNALIGNISLNVPNFDAISGGCTPGAAAVGQFISAPLINVTGGSYDPATGNASLITATASGLLPGSLFSLKNVVASDPGVRALLDVTSSNQGRVFWTAIAGTGGTTVNFIATAPRGSNLPSATISAGSIDTVPIGDYLLEAAGTSFKIVQKALVNPAKSVTLTPGASMLVSNGPIARGRAVNMNGVWCRFQPGQRVRVRNGGSAFVIEPECPGRWVLIPSTQSIDGTVTWFANAVDPNAADGPQNDGLLPWGPGGAFQSAAYAMQTVIVGGTDAGPGFSPGPGSIYHRLWLADNVCDSRNVHLSNSGNNGGGAGGLNLQVHGGIASCLQTTPANTNNSTLQSHAGAGITLINLIIDGGGGANGWDTQWGAQMMCNGFLWYRNIASAPVLVASRALFQNNCQNIIDGSQGVGSPLYFIRTSSQGTVNNIGSAWVDAASNLALVNQYYINGGSAIALAGMPANTNGYTITTSQGPYAIVGGGSLALGAQPTVTLFTQFGPNTQFPSLAGVTTILQCIGAKDGITPTTCGFTIPQGAVMWLVDAIAPGARGGKGIACQGTNTCPPGTGGGGPAHRIKSGLISALPAGAQSMAINIPAARCGGPPFCATTTPATAGTGPQLTVTSAGKILLQIAAGGDGGDATNPGAAFFGGCGGGIGGGGPGGATACTPGQGGVTATTGATPPVATGPQGAAGGGANASGAGQQGGASLGAPSGAGAGQGITAGLLAAQAGLGGATDACSAAAIGQAGCSDPGGDSGGGAGGLASLTGNGGNGGNGGDPGAPGGGAGDAIGTNQPGLPGTGGYGQATLYVL